MIKFKTILEVKEGKISDVAYHVAEKTNRSSIKSFGLNPKKYPDQNNLTTSGKHIYVFLDYDSAYWYVKQYNHFLKQQDEDEKEFDIWQVNTKGIDLIKDYTLNTGDDPEKDDAYMIKGIVDKKLLKLYKTIK